MLYKGDDINVPVQSSIGHSFEVSQSLIKLKESPNNTNKQLEKDSKTPILAKRGRMDDTPTRVMGWLDITEGSIAGGQSISRPLDEGEYVMIAAKVKQVEGMDTMMTRCGMEDGLGQVKLLTDERGCSLNRELIGNFQTKYNDATRVKEIFANFQVPQFGEKRHLSIKCGIVVCEGQCPLSPCEEKDDPIQMRDMVMLETDAVVRPGQSGKQAAAAVAPLVGKQAATAGAPPSESDSYNMGDLLQVNITD